MRSERVDSSSAPPSSRRSDGPEKGKGKEGKDFDDTIQRKKKEQEDAETQKKQKEKEERVAGITEMGTQSGSIASKGDAGQIKSIDPALAKTDQIKEINRLLKVMVEKLEVGKIDGKDATNMTLSTDKSIPAILQGTKMSVTMDGNMVSIKFDSEAKLSGNSLQEALNLIVQNKNQLLALTTALDKKHLVLNDVTIGNSTVNVLNVVQPPRVQETTFIAEQGRQQEREQKDQGDRGDQEERRQE